MSATAPRNHPRGEARSAIVRSARKLFGSKGYHGTSVREIANLAGVSEALLYRYFGGKKALFEESVREPYRGFIEDFLSDWKRLDAELSNADVVERFVTGLYDFVLENRDLLFALAAANRFGNTEISEAGLLSEGIRGVVEFATAEADARGLGHVDLEMAGSCTIALVMAMGILDDLLFPGGVGRPSKERLVREMTKYVEAGVQQPGGSAVGE